MMLKISGIDFIYTLLFLFSTTGVPKICALKNHFARGLNSAISGNWVKFISGASNQDVHLIRNMCCIYTMAGVDCIDLSADLAVLTAAYEGINVGMKIAHKEKPLVMISINDDDDLHFRKALFNPSQCPPSCPRPCEKVCPAWAIPPLSSLPSPTTGVIEEKCYGCGRCIPICPYGIIDTKSYVSDVSTVTSLLSSGIVDAIEIHTFVNHQSSFQTLWENLGESILNNLQLIAVSFPDMKNDTLPYLEQLQQIMTSHSSWSRYKGFQIWQADGRPMSGDIGRGTAHASVDLAYSLLSGDKLTPQSNFRREIDFNSGNHFLQLAGGTNDYSASLAENSNLTGKKGFAGFAFGGFARKQLGFYLNELEVMDPGGKVEDHPEVLEKCIDFATKLINSVKKNKQ